MLRIALYLAACFLTAGGLLLLFGWTAPGGQGENVTPVVVALERASIVAGTGQSNDSEYVVETTRDDGSAIVVLPVGAINADAFSFFEYVIDGQTSNLEVSFVWSPVGQPNVLHELVLPAGTGSTQVVRLLGDERWRGRVSNLAIAFFPVPQLSPPLPSIDPIRLRSARFLGPGLAQSVRARLTAWTAQHPWTFRSINYLGGLSADASEGSAMPYLALLALCSLFWAWLLLRDRLLVVVASTFLLLWFVPDYFWQQGLLRQQGATEQLFGDKVWPAHLDSVADTHLVALAEQIKRQDPAVLEHKVLVSGPSHYIQKRLIWHLSPVNSSMMEGTRDILSLERDDRVIDVPGPDGLRLRYINGHLRVAGTTRGQRMLVPARRVFQSPDGVVYRVSGPPVEVQP